MVDNRPRVAICLRGMLRTGIENKKTFEHYFEAKYNIDYFYHCWNIENGAYISPVKTSAYLGTKIVSSLNKRGSWELLYTKKKKFREVYKPKLGKFEDLDSNLALKSDFIIKPDPSHGVWDLKFHPQFISAFEVDKLRREYEIKNDFKYDLVINTRPDIALKPQSSKESLYNELHNLMNSSKSIGIVNIPQNIDKDCKQVDDVFFAGNSQNMKIFMDYYDINKNTTTFHFVTKYLLEKNIYPINLELTYCILRDYCSYLDPIKNFESIFIDDHRLTYGVLKLDHALATSKSLYKELVKRIDYGLL